jgi:hypothetical protein
MDWEKPDFSLPRRCKDADADADAAISFGRVVPGKHSAQFKNISLPS